MMRFQCDQCGACCRHHIIELDYADILREPRLREVTKPFRGDPDLRDDSNSELLVLDDPYVNGAMLAAGLCPMLGDDNRCGCYTTRPTVCVAYLAGSAQCQEMRQLEGLPRLEPVAASAITFSVPGDRS